jgi:hypothetical protein
MHVLRASFPLTLQFCENADWEIRMPADDRKKRSITARIAAYESWANTADRSARTAPARLGLLNKFEREARERLGPSATDRQVADAAESARRAHYTRLSVAGVAARRRRTSSTR